VRPSDDWRSLPELHSANLITLRGSAPESALLSRAHVGGEALFRDCWRSPSSGDSFRREGNRRKHQASEARAGPGGEAEMAARQASAVLKQSRRLLPRLRLRREEALRFMSDLDVPFDNDEAESVNARMANLLSAILCETSHLSRAGRHSAVGVS
jgi:hypothetical protein